VCWARRDVVVKIAAIFEEFERSDGAAELGARAAGEETGGNNCFMAASFPCVG